MVLTTSVAVELPMDNNVCQDHGPLRRCVTPVEVGSLSSAPGSVPLFSVG
jgi:hypothetical protein